MNRPLKITLQIYSDDGLQSYLDHQKTYSFAHKDSATKRLRDLMTVNYCAEKGVVIHDNFSGIRKTIINDKWYIN